MSEFIIGSGGGGGCFAVGTLVCTPDGNVPIESLKVGDKVISYNYSGLLQEDIVTETFIHYDEEVYEYLLWGKAINATPNHWVLNQYNAFVEIGSLTTDDCITDFMGHMRPMLSSKSLGLQTVYNLKVRDNHTFIANDLRVHNGGKGTQKPIVGTGGGGGGGKGGGGGGRQAVVAEDTLASKQYAKVLDLVCEGEIEGLVSGYKSIYLDDTPLQAADGTYNFATSGLSLEFRNGTKDQTPMKLFNAQESEISTDNHDITTISPKTIRIEDSYLDYIRLNLVVPRLSYTDTNTGDVSGTSIEYKVSVKQDANNVASSFQDILSSRTTTLAAVNLTPANTIYTASTTINSDSVSIQITPVVTGGNLAAAYYTHVVALEYSSNGTTWTEGGSTTYTVKVVNQPAYTYINDRDWAFGSQVVTVPAVYGIESITGDTVISKSLPSYSTWYIRLKNKGTAWALNPVYSHTENSYDSQTWMYTSLDRYAYANYPTITGITTSIKIAANTITGKCSNPYRLSFGVNITGMVFPVDIKVTRLTADSGSQYLQNKLILESYTRILTEKLTYPFSALVGLQLDATQFNTIPSRSYEMKLLKVKIPYGYTINSANPNIRTYPTVWDGTFVVGWTDNPAWVFYDLCTNKRYGLGNFIQEANIDIFQLYAIAKYCDELVPDGFGGQEPRYTCNLYIQSREEAYKVVSNLAGLFSSIVYWGVGSVNIMSDMQVDVSAVFNNSNVENGVFNYSTGSQKTRHSVALVSYIDKLNGYKPAIEYVEDIDSVKELNGIREVEVIAYGCTSRGQAHRMGRRILLTEKLENELVSFKTGVNAGHCIPGAIIKIADNSLNVGGVTGGRLIDYTSSTIQLDRESEFKNGYIYNINITLLNNTVKSIPIINPKGETYTDGSTGVYNSVTIKNSSDYLIVEVPLKGSVYVIGSNQEGNYSYWRVLGVKETEDLVYEVSCMKHDPAKSAMIDTGANFLSRDPVVGLSFEVPPIPLQIPNPLYTVGGSEPEFIDNIVIVESLYRLGKADIATRVNISWQGIPNASDYHIRYKEGINNWVARTNSVPYFELNNASDGQTYEIELRVANILGKISNPVKITHTVVGKLAPPSNVTGLTVTRNLANFHLQWNPVEDVDLAGYEIRGYTGTTDVPWESCTIISTNLQATSFTVSTTGAAVKYTYLVKAIDTTGHYSTTEASANYTILMPGDPIITVAVDNPDAKLKVIPAAVGLQQLPIARYDIVYGSSYNSPSGDVTEGLLDISYDPINYYSRQYWVKTYDTSNNASNAVSTTLTVPTLGAVNGLSYYFKNNKVYLSWTAPTPTGTTLPVVKYRIYKGNTVSYTSATFITEVTDPYYSQPIDWSIGASEKFLVLPLDNRGLSYIGSPNNILVVTSAPSIVSGFTKVQSGPNLLVTWATPTSTLDIKYYEVKVGGSDWNTATLVGTTNTPDIQIPLVSAGTLTIRVKATDALGFTGPEATTTYAHTLPAAITSAGYSFFNNQVRLYWSPPISITTPIDKYEVRYNGSTVGFTYASTFDVDADWVGSRTFVVRAIDTTGNIGTDTNIAVAINAPAAPVVSLSFSGNDVLVSFNTPTSSLPISYYEIRRGGTSWATATVLETTSNTWFQSRVDYIGTTPMNYWVKAYDVVGLTDGAVGSNSIATVLPTINSITAQVVDNNVLLYWTSSKGSLDIDTYEIRRGASWAAGTVVGDKSGGFTTIFETTSGTYSYWVAARDMAGNYSTPVSRSAIVNSPPDYIFRFKHDSTWNSFSTAGATITVTKNNCAIDVSDNSIIGPIYTAETWAAHFSTRSWASIQSQIDAGYVIYAQPSNTTSADYIEEVDYGTTISYMKVSVSYGGTTVAGSLTITPYISYKLNIGDSWSSEIPSAEAYCTNFRYVKVRLNISAANQQSLYKLTSMSVKLDAKAKGDAGTIIALESDASGSSVGWSSGVTFTDISSITLQPKAIITSGTLTHNIVGTTCTISCTSHNLVVGDKFYASFTGGTPPPSGTYTVTSKTATTIVFTVASGSGGGTPTIRKPLYALYDFDDVANPTGFKVYLYDSAGARCSGTVSWTAEGY